MADNHSSAHGLLPKGDKAYKMLVAAVCIGAAALGLRVVGLTLLPHHDEHHVVNVALGFGSGDLNPHQFWYGTLMMYLVFIIYGMMFVFLRLTGAVGSVDDFAVSFFQDPIPFYTAARIVSVAAGLGTVALVYLMARRAAGKNAGLVAAGLAGVIPALVVRNRVALPDSLLVFFVAACLLSLQSVAETGSLKASAKAGLFYGLSLATKILGGLLIVPIILAHFLASRSKTLQGRSPLAGIGLALLFMALGFFVGCPFGVIDYKKFFADLFVFQLSYNLAAGKSAWEIIAAMGRSLCWENMLLPSGCALGLLGAVVLLKKRIAHGVIFVSFTAAFVAFLAFQGRFYSHWLLPVFPAILVMLGVGFGWIADSLKSGCKRVWVMVVLAALIIIPPGLQTAGELRLLLAKPDPRLMAKQWVESHVPPGSVILMDGGVNVLPPLMESEECLQESLVAVEKQPPSGFYKHLGEYLHYRMKAAGRYTGPTYWLLRRRREWWKAEEDKSTPNAPTFTLHEDQRRDLEWYLEQGAEYVIILGHIRDSFVTSKGRERWPAEWEFYSGLEKSAKAVATFCGETLGGPMSIVIYRVEDISRDS
ncbi:MAG: phospholipid carrier-dependent glycosyltransferase [Armatimonadetes bacterium]|nr:phospholipid carrier-dependent glycosyltransferase [Armatimonadota bacterium]NIM24648.1 phospholipid carrier-dependent glycosyltransferase [Armatimonadota bacterium]NIM68527.1 phospholipid carrier-dependent glycosyltransferase [Armatimonadota bacterium]NIM76909.1 phospholipid carrier-dependent glycosyltransferase [Armatimonadota bacterium]NIN06721.1 phospholipid carrier-dependent glycosyltransferase [Armatimonadota bacterium]